MANVITLDGPTSSGKSSVGYLFSQKIGFQFIDTGAIYRAGCIKIIDENIPLDSKEQIVEVFKNLEVDFKSNNGKQHIFLEGVDITDSLHDPNVTEIVPIVAAIPEVRTQAKAIQRKIGESQNTVMTGRDIGSEIFPEAKLKFFITASPEVRAERRFNQLKKINPSITLEQVLDQMNIRDKADSEREASPMRIPEGAVIIDTTNLTTEETVAKMMEEFGRIKF